MIICSRQMLTSKEHYINCTCVLYEESGSLLAMMNGSGNVALLHDFFDIFRGRPQGNCR